MKALITLSLALLVSPVWAASPSPDGARIAYSFIGGPENIYVANADGSEAVALVEREIRDFRPEWFPDGRRVLFTSATDDGPQLVSIDLKTLHREALTAPDLRADDGQPSPDGRQVVFFRDAGDGFDLLLLDLETREIRALTNTPVFREYAPRWSPDGRKVVFVGREAEDAVPDLWILDLPSGERRNITATPAGDEFHPAWSPDGGRIAFVRVVDGEFAIHVLDLASGDDVQIAHEPGVACFSPHFTPDGRWVYFTRNLFEGPREGLPAVFRVRPDGRDLERIVGVPGRLSNENHPSWHPSGGELVFESDRPGNADLYVAELATGVVRRLTDSPAEDSGPVWSPDGRWIAFHSNREGNYDLYLVRPDGTGLRRLTHGDRDETSPAWDPTSQRIVFEDRIDRATWHLFVLDIATLAVRSLVAAPGSHLTPSWMTPDRIAFSYSPPGGNHDTDLVLRSVDLEGVDRGDLLAGAKGNSNVNYSPALDRVVFNSIRDGNWEIYSARPDGTETRRWTTRDGAGIVGIDGEPEWSPAGDRIAFTSGAQGSLDLVILHTESMKLDNLTARWRLAEP